MTSSRVALPVLGRVTRVRLWLSYQRYGLLLVGGSAAVVAAAIVATPVWVWVPLAALAFVPVRFGVYVLGRWPQKLRATRIAAHRIRAGRFTPEQVRAYCGDPCFRVVAREILARAGIPQPARRALMARLRDEHAARRDVLLLVDHASRIVTTLAGDGTVRRETLGSGGAEERS